MAKNNLNERSSEDLIKNKKALTVLTSMLAAMLVVIIVLALFQSKTNIMLPLIAVPLALSPIVIINYNQLRSINKELRSRNLK